MLEARGNMRKQTWFAIIICMVVIVPAFFAGALVSTICRIIVTSQIGPDPDLLFLRTLFGIETPGVVSRWIITVGFPAIIQGIVAGWLAALAANFVCPEANIATAAYSTGALYTVLALIPMILEKTGVRLDSSDFLAIVQMMGIWAGLVSTARSRASTPSQLMSQHSGT